eukprot:14397713-Alexandrium_andersonii.AAC.1
MCSYGLQSPDGHVFFKHPAQLLTTDEKVLALQRRCDQRRPRGHCVGISSRAGAAGVCADHCGKAAADV